jgi:hypothetical protein
MTRILQILNAKNFYTTKYTKKHEGFIFILRDLRDLRGKNITNRFNLCYPRSSHPAKKGNSYTIQLSEKKAKSKAGCGLLLAFTIGNRQSP